MHGTETEEAPRRGALDELRADPYSRKGFLKAAGGAGAAAALAALLSACGEEEEELTPGGSKPNTGAGVGTDLYGAGDLGIARYAVTLEYLEVDFYDAAVRSNQLKGQAGDLAKRFGEQERRHVAALEDAIAKLGGEPPARPEGQFPLSDRKAILEFAIGLESLGASAYLAQADRIEDKELLATALSIHSVEARHAAALAELLGQDPAPQAFAVPTQAGDVLSRLHRITSGNAA
jgi:rubrerythrin